MYINIINILQNLQINVVSIFQQFHRNTQEHEVKKIVMESLGDTFCQGLCSYIISIMVDLSLIMYGRIYTDFENFLMIDMCIIQNFLIHSYNQLSSSQFLGFVNLKILFHLRTCLTEPQDSNFIFFHYSHCFIMNLNTY